LKLTEEIQNLIHDGALFVSNHSGGVDSQAMYLLLSQIIPYGQLIVVHAHLPEVEWEGTIEFIKSTIFHPLYVVQAGKTFFEMVEHRKMFPSPENRQCTSDLKRNPINTQIRRLSNEYGYTNIVNCMGLRADESSGRKKKPVWKVNLTETNSKRTWHEWLPIHELTKKEAFNIVKMEGQKPFWVYAAGMTRKSCPFCIMSCESDLKTAAKLVPDLAKKYMDMEKKINFTLMMPKKGAAPMTLKEILTLKN